MSDPLRANALRRSRSWRGVLRATLSRTGLAFVVLGAATAHAQVGGVYIDAEGVLRDAAALDPSERLKALRLEAAAGPSGSDVGAASPLRKVSLRRLEAAVKAAHDAGDALPADVRYLAGLTRVQCVFLFPESGDAVLAGPAEGWRQLPTGEVAGERSGRPALELDDLIHALRTAFAPQVPGGFLGCSIEPTPEGMTRYATYMRSLGGRMDRSRLAEIFRGMEQSMGPQAVKLYGVPGTSRFALKMLAADYRLKRLALAHDPSPVPDVTSYLDLAAKRLSSGGTPQVQHRWWFVAGYDTILCSPDGLAFELEGPGVRVQTAPTFVAKSPSKGKDDKAKVPEASPQAKQFAALATKHFPKLAEKVAVFAELENLVGLAVAAELIAERSRRGANEPAAPAGADAVRVDYVPTHFLDAKGCPTAVAVVPTQTPSLTSYRLVDNRHWLISVSGGVEMNPREAARPGARQESPKRRLTEQRARVGLPGDAARWWWD